MYQFKRGDSLLIASHNQGKVDEFANLCAPFGVDVMLSSVFGLAAPVEDGDNFVANARIKAVFAAKGSNLPALSDDSGLCVDALEGAPGIYSARWAGPNKDFMMAMNRIHQELKEKNIHQRAKAYFIAALCLAFPSGEVHDFVGRVQGEIVWPPQGDKGFGYDPIFRPDGYDRTFGQMSAEEKHCWTPEKPGLSHRARAFDLFAQSCLDIEDYMETS